MTNEERVAALGLPTVWVVDSKGVAVAAPPKHPTPKLRVPKTA